MAMTKKPAYRKKRAYRKKTTRPRKAYRKLGIAPVNTAAMREVRQIPCGDNTTVIYPGLQLGDPLFDRAQAVARAYQEYRVKYIKLTFKPSCDTFAPAAGNQIPQLYFQLDLANSIETDCNFQTFLDMGVKPMRFDDKNIIKVWRPTVLTTDGTGPGTSTAAQVKKTPWLSTNAASGNPNATWSPSLVLHHGAVWFVTPLNPATPEITYMVECETVFEFRKPLWRSTPQEGDKKVVLSIESDPIVVH